MNDIFDEVKRDFEKPESVVKRVKDASDEPADGAPVGEKDAASSDAATSGMDPEAFAALRRDILRMWNPEPDETR